jgi:hypothetical protein
MVLYCDGGKVLNFKIGNRRYFLFVRSERVSHPDINVHMQENYFAVDEKWNGI